MTTPPANRAPGARRLLRSARPKRSVSEFPPLQWTLAGTYSIELVAKLLGRRKLTSLWQISLQIPAGAFGDDVRPQTAVFSNWSPETNRYVASVGSRAIG